jgi:hypothetical protein
MVISFGFKEGQLVWWFRAASALFPVLECSQITFSCLVSQEVNAPTKG